ncbi:AMP-binding protein [Psychrobacter sp.]|uniref:AMP-binding protein n=1 Tax=Psychrobacter sp. TaxID=56811 RepID=UPI003C75EF20
MLLQKIESYSYHNPQKIAVSSKNEAMTYERLVAISNNIALGIQMQQLKPNALVAVCMERSPGIIATLIGIMRAGCAYTIVELNMHHQETLSRLKSIQPDFIVTDDAYNTLIEKSGFDYLSYQVLSSFKGHLNLPQFPKSNVTAYVLFTSGSTGHPKGVEVSYDNLIHYCKGMYKKLNLSASSDMTFGHVSTLSADLGNTSLFLSLWTGGKLYLASESERKDPAALAQIIANKNIDILKITPTHWRLVLTALQTKSFNVPLLEYLILGGEALPIDLGMASLEHLTTKYLINHYGPTETTIGVTIHQTSLEELRYASESTLPIGLPFGDTQVILRCKDGKLHPTGIMEGELLIGGPSVTKGYRGLAQANARSFIPLPNYQGFYYCTGDRVRRDADGTLYFLGRIDRQVKVNGYRVELESVESEIRSLIGVEHVVVIHHRSDSQDYLLCAYSGKELNSEDIRQTLSQNIPSYMIPARFKYHLSLPFNVNGKVDIPLIKTTLVDFFERSRLKVAKYPKGNTSDKREQDIIEAFKNQLKGVDFTVNDDFFQLGGDSLDAIQLVSSLQLQGYSITASQFLAQPSVKGVLTSLLSAKRQIQKAHKKICEPTICSPAQQWFFRQNMLEENRWTQAMALEVGVKLDSDKLNDAFMLLISEHPMLSARFFCNEQKEWQFVTRQTDEKVFIPDLNNHRSWSERGIAIHKAYQKLELQLNIYTGQLCRATLINFKDGPSILVLVIHHLVVDIITWRLLLDDLMRHYAVKIGLEASINPLSISHFDEWCRHLRSTKELLSDDMHYWNSQPKVEPRESNAGQEKDSRTVWISMTEQETFHLSQIATQRWNSTLDIYVLAAYSEEAAYLKGTPTISIDVESHGRLSLCSDIDISRTAGWFTSIFPITFNINEEASDIFVSSVHKQMNDLPHLGTAYELLRMKDTTPSELCFNYAGQFRLGMRNDWQLTPADVLLPSLRGQQNNRIHEIKLTGRIYKQQLLLDINFSNKQYSNENMLDFARRLRMRLLRHIPVCESEKREPVLDNNNSTGAIWNPLPAFLTSIEKKQHRPYQNILLTGATGFIGIHVLEQLLKHTSASIHCLIRPRLNTTIERRLQAAWQSFFNLEDMNCYKDRIHCIPADLTQPKLGLTTFSWDILSKSIDAIYHFAADTKLVGSIDIACDNILKPVEGCICLAEIGKQKDLHFMSTLAVSGTREGKQPRSFDETSLKIDQNFQNSYERYKYDAEVLVHNFAYKGGNTFIYRTGNVTGQSNTGKFQQNATDNRWVQCLKGIIALGQIPLSYSDTIVLSPVDIVAQGLVALSLDTSISSGTFHLDSEYGLPVQEFVEVLEQYGAHFEKVDSISLEQLFRESNLIHHKDVAIGYFWFARGERNINFSHTKTKKLLQNYDIKFEKLDIEWVRKFIKNLLEQNAIELFAPNKELKGANNIDSNILGKI